MSTVAAADSTVGFIRSLVRELTASPSESALATSYIDQTLNEIYMSDFPYAIKLDQMRSVYTFYTQPYVGRYPLDVNFNQGMRSPVYVDGIQGYFSKSREEFFRMWPKFPTLFNQYGSTGLTSGIQGASQNNPCVITSSNHGLTTGQNVYIQGVEGMTELNGGTYSVNVLTTDTFEIDVDSTLFTAYTQGGTWWVTPVAFDLLIPGPFLSGEVTIGGTDYLGNPFVVADDGNGILVLVEPNPQISVPNALSNPAYPGMYNLNTANPGLINPTPVGSVNYVTGSVSFELPLPLAVGTTLNIHVSQYQTGLPYSILFWNNYFEIRPIPKLMHKVTVETYLTPVQFMQSTDLPILRQWAKWLGYRVAIEVLTRRQDMQGVSNLMPALKKQETLALERQAVEEIGQRNSTIFSSSTPSIQGGSPYGNWYY